MLGKCNSYTTWEKGPYVICEQRRSRSAYASMQSDLAFSVDIYYSIHWFCKPDQPAQVKIQIQSKSTQQAHNIKITSYQRRCDVITSHRRWYDVILTLCACLVIWSLTGRSLVLYYLLLLWFSGSLWPLIPFQLNWKLSSDQPGLKGVYRVLKSLLHWSDFIEPSLIF